MLMEKQSWMPRPDGSCVRPGFEHGREVCMSCGECVPHCHYEWAVNLFWAKFSDENSREIKKVSLR